MKSQADWQKAASTYTLIGSNMLPHLQSVLGTCASDELTNRQGSSPNERKAIQTSCQQTWLQSRMSTNLSEGSDGGTCKKKEKNTFINTLNNVTLCGGVWVMTTQDGTFNCLKATYYCCSCTAEFWTSDSFATDVSKVSWEDCKKKLKKKRQASQLHKNNPSNHHLLRISHILLNCVLESLKSPIVPQLRSTFLHRSPCAKRVKGSGGLLHQSELKHKT